MARQMFLSHVKEISEYSSHISGCSHPVGRSHGRGIPSRCSSRPWQQGRALSEFRTAFDRSFAIQRAISAASSEANASGFPVRVSDVMKHLGFDLGVSDTSEMAAEIISAATDAGTTIVVSDPAHS